MKKQLSILLVSTAILLSGCSSVCRDKDPTCGRCDNCEIQVKERIVLETPAYFAFDSAELTTTDKANLNQIAERLKANPAEKVRINGYTDITGSPAYNVKLSEERAMSAAKCLEKAGISSNRISTKGYGASEFAAPNTTSTGRAKNRRIEVLFYE